ncbi:MAG TPA: hypothetical protein VLM38_05430 [Blastocatellia bacterium]|nr:hypothetical protein [Blastocatellia bacterium]
MKNEKLDCGEFSEGLRVSRIPARDEIGEGLRVRGHPCNSNYCSLMFQFSSHPLTGPRREKQWTLRLKELIKEINEAIAA